MINAGSSSIKYCLFDSSKNEKPLLKGVEERVSDHRKSMQVILEKVSQFQIDAVGHRVVHGGEKLKQPTLITEEVIEQIREAGRFVPLHCPPNLIGIEAAKKLRLPQVAVFDTAAHAKMPFKAFLYAIPEKLYAEHHIRKYGFHGINHLYVAQQAEKYLSKNETKIITCHLGNGCSITAFENGVSIDTSMGLTPLEGLVMGSRCGDIDPSVVFFLNEVVGLKTDQIVDLLNKKSGLIGLCGKSDMRDIIAQAEQGDQWSHIAIELFVYRIQKYIGAYIAALNGVDAIVFTAGIGENSAYIRERVLKNFSYVGVVMDPEKNQHNETLFSADHSKIKLLRIPANEELVIAQQTASLLN